MSQETIASLALDGQGNAAVTGFFQGETAQFGVLTITNSIDPA